MATQTDQLEQRVSEIERELAKLRGAMVQRDDTPWWQRIIGEFEGDEAYSEIVRLGQDLRRAERPE